LLLNLFFGEKLNQQVNISDKKNNPINPSLYLKQFRDQNSDSQSKSNHSDFEDTHIIPS